MSRMATVKPDQMLESDFDIKTNTSILFICLVEKPPYTQ